MMNQGSTLPLTANIGDLFYNNITHRMYKMTPEGWYQLPEPMRYKLLEKK